MAQTRGVIAHELHEHNETLKILRHNLMKSGWVRAVVSFFLSFRLAQSQVELLENPAVETAAAEYYTR